MKLHEILAVESNLKGQAETTRQDLKATFASKRHHFTQRVVTFTPTSDNGDGAQAVTEESLDLQTTVAKELRWIGNIIAPAIDAGLKVADANTRAKANIVLEDGTVIAENVPATALLELEKRVAEIADLVSSIPTLDPAKGFVPDSTIGVGVFKARADRKIRTRKDVKVLTLAPATDKHPAQAQAINVDVPVGEVVTQEWSGLLSVAQKGDMLERVERLRRAVKQARARANDERVVESAGFGKKLLNYVFDQQ